MKKHLLILALVLVGLKSFGQMQADTSSPRYHYLKKSQNQKTAGWIMLGAGTAMAAIGLVQFSQEFDFSGGGDGAAALSSVGFLAMLGSIPLFIASGRNARKAATVSLNTEPVPFLLRDAFVLKKQVALTFRVPL